MEFCTTLQLDPLLATVEDPIPILQVFAQRYRDGRIAKDGKPVAARSVEDAVRAVGQTMASMGAQDKRLGPDGRSHEFRLKRQYQGYARGDKPAKRVRPVPLAIVQNVGKTVVDAFTACLADMCIIGFFFLCRPGEYVDTQDKDSKSAPFRLCDVELHVGKGVHSAATAPLATLETAWAVTLVYTTQKNSVPNQGITHGKTKHSVACPTKAVLRRVRHLREHNAPPTTPLYTYFDSFKGEVRPRNIYSKHITDALRRSAACLESTLGICPSDISARSLRPGGATAMLCANIDRDFTQLVGRWKSDEMLKYLHAQAAPAMRQLAQRMFCSGHFTYRPDQDTKDPSTFVQPKNQL